MNISVVIPNYNGEELLKQNLQKVIDILEKNKKSHSIEIILADDCSTDNSLQVIDNIREANKESLIITVLQSKKNLGFSSNINKGIVEAKGEIVILLNSDVIPTENFLPSLLSHFEEKKVFAVGCMDKSIEDGKAVLRGRGLLRWDKGFVLHKRGEVDKTDTAWVSGGSGAFRKEIVDMLGGFDSLFDPFYWEDIDLSYRALKSGYLVVFEPQSVVIHDHSKGSIKKHYSKQHIKNIAYRNQFIFVWKDITDINLLISHFLWLPYHLFNGLKGDMSLVRGFFLAFSHIPKILNSRSKAKKFFTLSDRHILSKYSKD